MRKFKQDTASEITDEDILSCDDTEQLNLWIRELEDQMLEIKSFAQASVAAGRDARSLGYKLGFVQLKRGKVRRRLKRVVKFEEKQIQQATTPEMILEAQELDAQSPGYVGIKTELAALRKRMKEAYIVIKRVRQENAELKAQVTLLSCGQLGGLGQIK